MSERKLACACRGVERKRERERERESSVSVYDITIDWGKRKGERGNLPLS